MIVWNNIGIFRSYFSTEKFFYFWSYSFPKQFWLVYWHLTLLLSASHLTRIDVNFRPSSSSVCFAIAWASAAHRSLVYRTHLDYCYVLGEEFQSQPIKIIECPHLSMELPRTHAFASWSLLDRHQWGPIRSVLLVIIGWLVMQFSQKWL